MARSNLTCLQPTHGGGSNGGGGGGSGGGGGGNSGQYLAQQDEGPSSFEPPDVFCALGSLIVEGRLRSEGRGGGRGFAEGPHVELPGRISRHKCSAQEYLCNKNENFRRHMLLLWQNNVPMSIEVLLCSDCRVGRAKAGSLEVTTVPEPGSILLEQWTVAILPGWREAGMDSLSLLQAVRSYLHFSQLSAWYSKTGGERPTNVLIRITLPGQEFASKFSQPPKEHFFPLAGVGFNSSVAVSVRSLPRSDEIPRVVCSHTQQQQQLSPGEDEASKQPTAVALDSWALDHNSSRHSEDLRRSLVKARLVATEAAAATTGPLDSKGGCPGGRLLSKSDSMDSMLGESLLDPPQSLSRMTPRRYQSPSRCGSPSLEAPDHLLLSRVVAGGIVPGPAGPSGHHYRAPPPSYDQAVFSMAAMSSAGRTSDDGGYETALLPTDSAMTGGSQTCRLNRHDLLRRRDLNLFHGLHPRLLHGQPRLSLPPKPPYPPPAVSSPQLPCRARVTGGGSSSSVQPSAEKPAGKGLLPLTDRLPNHCTQSGKHICQYEEELEEATTTAQPPAPMATTARTSAPLPCQQGGRQHQHFPTVSPSSSSSSTSSSSSPPPSFPPGDNYQQMELGGAKARRSWTGRHQVRTAATPYSRDSSNSGLADRDQAPQQQLSQKMVVAAAAAVIKPSSFKNGLCCPEEPVKEGLSQGEMEEVLQLLRARASPTNNRRPSLKDEQQQNQLPFYDLLEKSRRPSLDEIFEPLGRKCLLPQVAQVYRAELSSPSPAGIEESLLPGPSQKQWKVDKALPAIHTVQETCRPQFDSSTWAKLGHHRSSPQPLEDEPHFKDDLDRRYLADDDELLLDDNLDAVEEAEESIPCPLDLSHLCEELETKCLISHQQQKGGCNNSSGNSSNNSCNGSTSPHRARSYSETAKTSLLQTVNRLLDPLDISLEEQCCWSSWSFSTESVDNDADNIDESCRSYASKPEKRRNSVEDDGFGGIPSANKKAAFRKSFDSAVHAVFHSRNGLPLTSSPAPMRRGIKFDFDSGLNTPKDIKRALFECQSPEESECGSPKKKKRDPRRILSTSAPPTISGNNLLGNFEESVLNGRLEPVSTVEGFTAEIGASGSFHPKHLTFPVTVFFYTLCENSNIASPYLGHINLGKKGYRVPEKGTIQLTLFNPLGTVVKMFVVMYDLTDMPPNSQTFLRQRTLYMPADQTDNHEDARKWLRYLIHIRVASSKSGKIYLHTDVRMIIFRKSDMDTATDHEQGKGFELRSFTRGPTNPKFSPRK